jgi:DNA-binding CsgD family transcriptional regulator
VSTVERTDLDTILPALLRIYPLGDPKQLREETIKALAPLIEHDALVFATMLTPTHSLEHVTYHGVEATYVDRAAKQANLLTREALSYLEGMSTPVVRSSDVVTFEQLQMLPHYRMILEPNGLRWEVSALFFRAGMLVATLTLWRRADKSDFSDRDKAILETIHPHVSIALDNLIRAGKAQTELEEPDGSCALLFDETGTLQGWSETATELLRAEADRQGNHFALGADSVLVRELGERVRAGAGGRGLIRHDDLGSIRFALDRRAAGGVMARLEAPMFNDAARHSARLGLTLREYEIVRHLAAGSTAREIGERLEITIHTARTHIKNIYEKLGVANRAELVRRVARGSTPPPRPTTSE